MNRKVKFVVTLLVIWIVMTISLQQFGKILKAVPSEVRFVNYKFISKKYDKFLFNEDIEKQLQNASYKNETLVALDQLRSWRYNYYAARDYNEIYRDALYGYEVTEIIKELDQIYNEVGRKSTFLGYLLSNSKWVAILALLKLGPSVITRIRKKLKS